MLEDVAHLSPKPRQTVINDNTSAGNVAEKVTGDKGSDIDPWQEAQRMVRDWEEQNHHQLTKRTKELALRIALVHTKLKRGVVRTDLERWYRYDSGYARRRIFLLTRKNGLLKPIKGRRIGRLQEYFISTELDRFAHPAGFRRPLSDEELQEATTFIQYLVGLLSERKPTFHKLSFYAKIPADLYSDLAWRVEDPANKTKVNEFRLDYRRTVKFNISPNGTTVIYLESTQNPYHLHTRQGLVEVFESLGEARSMLKAECDNSMEIPHITSWILKLFDSDKTIPMSEIKEEMTPSVLRWWSDEGVKVEYLGEAFQIYGKVMPGVGKALRFERGGVIREDKPLDEGILEAISPEVKLISAHELLKKRVEKLEERLGDNVDKSM